MTEYIERFYRKEMDPGDLVSFQVQIKESDLVIFTGSDLQSVVFSVLSQERANLEAYIRYQPDFLTSLVPVAISHFAPPICQLMAETTRRAGVGPMAAVAGAINDRLAIELRKCSDELIIENGGDLFVDSQKERVVGIYAGEESPFGSRLGIRLPSGKPWGVATSSGRIGPSLSFGKANAVTILSGSSSLADAWATR
ncbi:MAG: UPF0280 family protein, partial [Candidatus Atribacteria bacterium]|nr:UPF0280 family protein [Candidatus Atribacteria bacterium]